MPAGKRREEVEIKTGGEREIDREREIKKDRKRESGGRFSCRAEGCAGGVEGGGGRDESVPGSYSSWSLASSGYHGGRKNVNPSDNRL